MLQHGAIRLLPTRLAAIALVTVVLTIVAVETTQEPAADRWPATGADSIEQYFSDWPVGTQIAIGHIDGDSESVKGWLRTAGGWQPIVNHEAAFEIGSITKLFTGTLLAQMVISGSLKLDDRMAVLLPFPVCGSADDGQKITLMQLANHSSGLPSVPSGFLFHAAIRGRARAPYVDFDSVRLADYVGHDLETESKPGAEYHYSNLGMGLLGQVLSYRAGATYEQLLQDSLLMPLGMKKSSTHTSSVQSWLVKGIDFDGSVAPNWDMGALAGAGGVKSTLSDMMKFVRAAMDGRRAEFELARRPTFTIEPDIEIGMGWNIYHLGPDTVWYGHDGGTRGYQSALRIDMAHQRGVVILSNISDLRRDSRKVPELCIEMMRKRAKL